MVETEKSRPAKPKLNHQFCRLNSKMCLLNQRHGPPCVVSTCLSAVSKNMPAEPKAWPKTARLNRPVEPKNMVREPNTLSNMPISTNFSSLNSTFSRAHSKFSRLNQNSGQLWFDRLACTVFRRPRPIHHAGDIAVQVRSPTAGVCAERVRTQLDLRRSALQRDNMVLNHGKSIRVGPHEGGPEGLGSGR